MGKAFRTEVDVKPFPFKISYSTPMLLLGSCFAQNIGQALQHHKLPALVNPFGVVYNPVSVLRALKRIRQGTPYSTPELENHKELWFSFDHHTSFSHTEPDETLKNINHGLAEAHEHWQNTQHLLLTFGTAWVFYLKENEQPVANCHKIPASHFNRRLLTVEDVVNLWENELKEVFRHKPNLKVLLTISPVRHLKDGPQGNQVSKATLILAVNQLTQLFPNQVFYFPSYEIVMDDLRDYRFYESDMIHISQSAIDYIWVKFKNSLVDAPTQEVMEFIQRIVQAVNHKPFNTNTTEFKQFVENTLQRIEQAKKMEPSLDFTDEIELLNHYICT